MATVKLYYTDQEETSPSLNRHWELNPGALFHVDNIAEYLATKTAKTISNFQYVKNELLTGITIDFTQLGSQPKGMQFRYVSIQNSGELDTYYYFVKNVIWRSKSAVRLELVMDVLNTFTEGTHYTFKENTKITREHKDRFTFTEDRVMDIVMIDYDWQGTLSVGDTVDLLKEQGGSVYTGVITEIDENFDWLKVKITSSETDEAIYEDISTHIEDYFEVSSTDNPADYVRFYFERPEDYQIAHYRYYYRNIDYIQENINPLLQCGNAQGRLVKSITALDDDWYLLYRNQNDPSDSLVNPVDCFLIPHNEKKCNSGTVTDGRIRPDFIENGKFYYFGVVVGRTYSLSNGVTITGSSGYPRDSYLCITKSGTKLSVSIIENITASPNQYGVRAYYDDLDYISINTVPVNYYENNTFIPVNDNFSPSGTFKTFDNTGTYNIIDELAKLDRTDAKNIKLIKIPYCPYDFSVSGDILQTKDDTTWEYVTVSQASGGDIHVLRLKDLNSTLKSNIDIATINSPFANLKMSSFTPSIDDLRQGSLYESKLFNSEFYQPTYVYDSFSYKIQLEKCDVNYYISNQSLRITFLMTKTINSKFMFNFDWYYLKNAESNYAQVMPIARNNEEVLYNVPYINYIRTGYQYDVKNKNISNISNAIGLGLSAVSIGASLLVPSAPLKVAGVVASIISMATSVKNTITSAMNNTNSIEQKLKQTQNQASSVSGSDDVDLMSAYAENRLKYLVYEPNQVMKLLLNDLFFYAGYRSERMGLPNHNTRVNFDYLECDAVFENLGSIPNDCLEELVNAFKNGVTYLHKTTRNNKTKWDFRQEYENWEVSLLGE